jgi:hypothetical protein
MAPASATAPALAPAPASATALASAPATAPATAPAPASATASATAPGKDNMRYLIAIASLYIFLSSSLPYKPPPRANEYINISEYKNELPLSLYGYSAPTTWIYAQTMERWYNIPLYLLRSLMYWESGGNLNAVNKNPNGSIDNGPLQYNNRYLHYYSDLFNNGELFDPCSMYSIQIAARELTANHRALSWEDTLQLHNKGEKGYSSRILNVYLKFSGIRGN